MRQKDNRALNKRLVQEEREVLQSHERAIAASLTDSALMLKFQRLKEKVLEKKPVLREILAKRGAKNLFEYAKLYIDVNLNPPIRKRQDEFIETFEHEVAKRLGQDIAKSAGNQLRHYYFVSTADHHGPICHPFFINSNLLTAAPHFEKSDPYLKNVIVLACGNVSLNNSSFPRGLLFNTFYNGRIETRRLSFFPAGDRLCPVYNFRGFSSSDIKKVQCFLRDMVKDGTVHYEEAEKINSLLNDVYARPEIFEAVNFSDQVTKTNAVLWKKFFGYCSARPPNLIYLEQETLVNELLINHHIHAHTIITHFLFDTDYDSMIAHYFEGITGAFSREDKSGTYLFWGLPQGAKYRIQLWKEGRYLVSADGSYRFELTPENLQKALQTKELVPSMMLCYTVLSFYYGLKCLGGFSQVNYLTLMKNAYIKMQVDLGNYRSIEVCARAQTKEMGGDFTISFLGGPNGEMVPATGLDLILYGDQKTWPCVVEQSKLITLEEGVNPLMPEFYRIVYPESEREAELMSVTAEDITKLTNLDKKIRACARVKVRA